MRHQAMMDEPCPHRAIGVSGTDLHNSIAGENCSPIGFFFPGRIWKEKSRYSQFLLADCRQGLPDSEKGHQYQRLVLSRIITFSCPVEATWINSGTITIFSQVQRGDNGSQISPTNGGSKKRADQRFQRDAIVVVFGMNFNAMTAHNEVCQTVVFPTPSTVART